MTLYVRVDLVDGEEQAISAVGVAPLKWTAVLRGDLEQPTWGFRAATTEELEAETPKVQQQAELLEAWGQTGAALYAALQLMADPRVKPEERTKLRDELTAILKHHGVDGSAPLPLSTREHD